MRRREPPIEYQEKIGRKEAGKVEIGLREIAVQCGRTDIHIVKFEKERIKERRKG